MTTIVVPVATSPDDVYWATGTGGGFNNNAALIAGDQQASRYDAGAHLRFVAVAIPAGSQIVSASLTLTAWLALSANPTSTTVQVRGEAADSPTAVTSTANASTRTRTTAKVLWSPTAWVENVAYQSPDIAGVIQEVVDRPGWASGNALALFWEHNTAVGFQAAAALGAYAYDQSPSVAPVLTVTYTNAAPETHAGTGQALAATVTLGTGAGVAVHPFTPAATVDAGQVTLTWGAQPGATEYAVERDGTVVAFDIPALTYTDTPGDGDHTYRVGVMG